MSWGTCYSASNNIHFDFPPIMDDGRNYASWQPGGALNEQIRKDNKIHSNWAYRLYLQNNADNIIRVNQLSACDECCSCPAKYGNNNQPNNGTPFLYKSCSDNSQPYGYERSDLKNLYLSDTQLQSRMVTPVITQEQILRQGYKRAN
jgi:hypothetical protein